MSVSIILPTLNGSKRISQALESVISQTYTDWELLVIDDGSTDETGHLVSGYSIRDPRIHYIKNENNLGVQKSLNKGLREAKGEYIARIDDDDLWIDSNKLKIQVAYLEQNKDCVLVGTNAKICDSLGRELGEYFLPETDTKIRARMLSKNCFIHPSIVSRKSVIMEAGAYDEKEETKHIEDFSLWLRIGLLGKMINLNSIAVQLTVHSQSMTFTNRLVQAYKMYALIPQYKGKYPHFFIGRLFLGLRIIGFSILKIIPLPHKVLYGIQKIYKEL
ncbi:MAG: glycosyltransferase family 2 protein [Candidatus Paceibacterota bacterium]